MDIRSSPAAQSYAQTRPATAPLAAPVGTGGAESGFTRLIGDFAETLRSGEQTAAATMTGNAEPRALVEALAASELAVETAVTLRDKVVEAYQEILRMQV
ncbi:MAG TPA: flagellar hook-basal body complex protein FliE [Albidovulum sp.]|uniref:flagellar hook-basal body complex protein FliE n=1 Tax=Albidovulum sp. TaxID=1872424 RepID=UPI002C57DFF6|nr:flagellar hook-basal body complex protein FliE [Albidovulum sp.]